MATEPLPARTVPTTQGSARARATTTACRATTRTRQVGSRASSRADPSIQATAVTRTIGTTAGANPAATAITAPRMTTWPTGRLRQCGPGSTAYGATLAARARRRAMNGNTAKATSPSQRPVPSAP